MLNKIKKYLYERKSPEDKLRYLRENNWPSWLDTCICGHEIKTLQIPYHSKLGISVRRCTSDKDGDRTICPLYREHEELLKQGLIAYSKL